MNNLLKIPAVYNSRDLNRLRIFFDKVEVQIRNLKSLGIEIDSYCNLLTPIILDRVPRDLVLEFNRKYSEGYKIQDVLTFLESEIQSRERALLVQLRSESFKSGSENSDKNDCKNGSSNSKSYKNYAATANYVASTKKHCVFCNSPDHEFCEYKTIEDRRNKLQNENRCFKCFSKNHYSRMCRLKVECKFCKSKFHSYVLCENAKNKPLSNDKVNEQNNSVVTQCNSSALKSNILLLTCSVIASAGKDSNSVEIARVLLDNGSERSWITKSLASRLKLNIVRRERLSVYSFGSVKTSERIYEVAKLKLSNRNNSESSIEIEVLVTQTITSASLAVPNVNVQNALQQKGLFLADMCNSENEIEVLIGGDVFWGIICDSKVFKINETLSCVPTMFGLAIQGVQQNCNSSFVGVLATDCVIAKDVQVLWDLDVLGNTDKEELTLTDKRIIDRFQSNLKFIQGRYETRLLWKFSPIELGNNFCNAKKRFDELQIILRKDEWLAKEYNKIIEEQERLGIVQECIRTENEYFMPHRPVVRIDKDTTKVRLVFNCSSKLKQNISLNDALECGPNLNANILDIMLNFRKFKIAFNADIEKAFLMISIAKNDRNYLKFIWASNNSEGYKIMQMNRLPFGCTMSNFVLSATIKTHIKKYEDNRRKTVEMLKSSLYVDDLYFGAESMEEAFQLSSDAVSVLKDGGFNLRKLRSNSVELESLWVDQGLSTSECLENCQLKVLGLNWNTKEDSLSLDVKSLLSNLSSLKNTKRCVLQTAAMIFDPMGFLSPFVVRIRCLMQDIWKIGADWDDELPENLTLKWRKWYGEIKDLDFITVERYFFLNVSDLRDSVEIHIFSDASLVAYGAVAYFRYSNKKGEVSTSFIMSKVRVAPLKKLTLPRLELLGVLVAAKLCKYLSGLFNNLSDRVILWTDSEICLCWIRGSFREWKQFVANRICLIQDLTSPSMWKFCPGLMNPADKLTRGESLSLLKNDSVWWCGPKWLTSPRDEWPLQKQYCSNDAAKVELLKVSVNTVVSSYSPVLKVNDFSNFKKLLRVTAWVLRFISKSRKLSIEKGPLSAIELQEAEKMWIKTVQWEVFREEIQRLQKNQQISKSSKIYSLSPYLDETGVLRVRGRLKEAPLTENEKHPVLLPKSKFAELVIFHEHLRVFHSGVSSTLAQVRKKFWIPKGRQTVKRVISTCLICKKYSLKPAKQLTGQLPLERIAESPPFTNVGTDFSGAITVKSKLNSCEKVYIVLFTCAVTRAVHIEVVQDMSVKSFILALRRFLARRGNTKIIFSDNAKTFRSSCEILKSFRKIIKHPELQNFVASENIIWKFIPERSPWWGGFWERLMKSIKDPLRKILGRALLTLEELATILTEIEFILNNRPITYEFNDLNEPIALTPSCFLFPGKDKINFPNYFLEVFDKNSNQKTLQKRKLFQTRLIKQIWSQWKEQYLLQLRSAHNFLDPHSQQNLKIGDVVLVEGPLKNKLLWDMGVIDKVLIGRDGNVRACIVRTSKGCLRRAIQLLYPFEVTVL
ncbi:uncharacterized protein LOC129218764 [Uloborus diversus]|uniref:uncharacterized protein LOC129218764 n=1 Tax=Uloborus diversus TaxID=327109 RepID=UPI00240A3131|nr:uncharacterized protein LOC129218764 [Uloborus diversus]